MTFKILFVVIVLVLNAGCFSMLIRKGDSESEIYWTKLKEQNDELSKIDVKQGIDKSIEQCEQKPTKYIQRLCYANLFVNNEDKKLCKSLTGTTVGQYICYFQIIKDKRLKRSEVKSFCPDSMCLAVFAYRHYGTDGADPEFLPYRERARQIENETSYSLSPAAMPPPTLSLEFHEVLHSELRTNRAFGVGYDLNFKYGGNELPSIGIGYYNLAEKIYSVDVVVSGVQKPVVARLAIGAEFKDDYETRYHLLYALGLGVKSAGVAPLLELSSDFKKDHQLVLGFMILFQPARKN
jgi:hypothetical protein